MKKKSDTKKYLPDTLKHKWTHAQISIHFSTLVVIPPHFSQTELREQEAAS